MTIKISNSDDVIDSRNVIARIEELENDRTTWLLGVDDWDGEHEDERDELAALTALQEEAEGYAPDWQYGTTLIRDSYFTEYAEELVDDIGDLPSGVPGYIVIDWDATARNIQQDYTSVEFDGVTYWVR